MSITLYYNADCSDCARLASRTRKLDWLDRIEFSTVDSPIGPVPAGKLVVVEPKTQRTFTGIYATRMTCLQVPAYVLAGLALYIPPIRKFFGRKKPGCNGDACEI